MIIMSLFADLLETCAKEVKNFGVMELHDYTIIFDDGDYDNVNFYDIARKVIESIPLPKKND